MFAQVEKKIIRHLEPERIKKVVEEHVYLPQPIVETEHKVIIPESNSRHEHGENSSGVETRSTRYIKDRPESDEYDSSYDKKHSSNRRSSDKGRGDDRNESERGSSGKGKGRQVENRHSRNEVSRRDRKRSSSREGRWDRKETSHDSSRHHATRSRSRSRSRSSPGKHSPPPKSSSRRDHERSGNKKREKSLTPEPEPQSSDEDNDEDDDAYYGSDTNDSDVNVPPASTRPRTPPPGSFDPYAALGLQDKRSTADQIDIDATYKFLVRKWHPDRHMSKPKEEQEKATERTAELNRAYDILGNEARKKVYDRTGKTDLSELDQVVERERRDAMTLARPAKGLQNFFAKK